MNSAFYSPHRPGFMCCCRRLEVIPVLLRTFPNRENPFFCQPNHARASRPAQGHQPPATPAPAPPATGRGPPQPGCPRRAWGRAAREGRGREGRPTAPLTDLGEGGQQDPEGDLEGDLHVGVVQGEDVEPRLLESGAAGARRGAGAYRRGAGQLALRGGPRLRQPGRQHRQHRHQHRQQRRSGAPGAAVAAHGLAPLPARRAAALRPRAGRRHHPAAAGTCCCRGPASSPVTGRVPLSAPSGRLRRPFLPGRPRGRPRGAKPRTGPAAAPRRPRAAGAGRPPAAGQPAGARAGCGPAGDRGGRVFSHPNTHCDPPVHAAMNRPAKV